MNQHTGTKKKDKGKLKKTYLRPSLRSFGSIVQNTGGAGTQANESAAMML